MEKPHFTDIPQRNVLVAIASRFGIACTYYEEVPNGFVGPKGGKEKKKKQKRKTQLFVELLKAGVITADAELINRLVAANIISVSD